MIIKLFIKTLLRNKNSYVRAVKLDSKTYVINIEEYNPIDETLRDWREKIEEQ